jgi:hypothetical protein
MQQSASLPSNCQFVKSRDGFLRCVNCDQPEYPPKDAHGNPVFQIASDHSGWPIRMCKTVTVIQKGPGDHLHDLILRWFGEEPTEACGCNSYINKMNAWGVEGCRRRIDRIARRLFVEAGRRRLLDSRIPTWGRAKLAGAKWTCRWLVQRAIVRVERQY